MRDRLRAQGLGGAGAHSPAGDREPAADSRFVSYWCSGGHQTRLRFAAAAEPPAEWPCASCALPAGPDQQQPPLAPPAGPANGGRTPYEYLRMRRSAAEGERLLDEALARLRGRTGGPTPSRSKTSS